MMMKVKGIAPVIAIALATVTLSVTIVATVIAAMIRPQDLLAEVVGTAKHAIRLVEPLQIEVEKGEVVECDQ